MRMFFFWFLPLVEKTPTYPNPKALSFYYYIHLSDTSVSAGGSPPPIAIQHACKLYCHHTSCESTGNLANLQAYVALLHFANK